MSLQIFIRPLIGIIRLRNYLFRDIIQPGTNISKSRPRDVEGLSRVDANIPRSFSKALLSLSPFASRSAIITSAGRSSHKPAPLFCVGRRDPAKRSRDATVSIHVRGSVELARGLPGRHLKRAGPARARAAMSPLYMQRFR